MKAITIYQPWASLIACGAKKYETRSWATNYRGKIAIHAGAINPYKFIKQLDDKNILEMMKSLRSAELIPPYGDFRYLPLGAIIATAELVECWEIHGARGRGASSRDVYIDKYCEDDDVTIIDGNEILFGDWTPGRYAWEFTNVKLLDVPIPVKGKQRLWEWEAEQ